MKRRPLWVPLLVLLAIALGGFSLVFAEGWSPSLGLDLAGGAYVVYAPAHKTTTADINEAASIITNRTNGMGISNAQVQTQGQNIVVQIAGIKNPRSVVNQIGQTGQVEFRPVICTIPLPPYHSAKGASSSSSITPSILNSICTKQTSSANSQSNELSAIAAQVPSTSCNNTSANASQDVLYPEPSLTKNKAPYYRMLLGPMAANGTIIANANAGVVTGTPGYVVQFTTTSKGSATWDSIAKANFHKQVAITLACQIVSAPQIQPNQQSFTSFNGQGEISSSSGIPQSTAQSVALAMKYGALPVQLHPQTFETVSPSLGKASLRAGLLAGLLGMLLVMVYTILYYRALGIVVVTGLGITALLLWTITSILSHTSGETLDLAGVTGVIVSIGVTVDSYIVYFERLKDDIRQGKTVRSSGDKGFARAYRTVLAADAVSLIGAVILYLLAIGPVRGFALFLGISTLLDVITAYFFTRPLVILMGRNHFLTHARWIGVARGLTPEPLGSNDDDSDASLQREVEHV